jgi:hypothetical protein
MDPICASCTYPVTVFHHDSQEWICHECGSVVVSLQHDVYTNCIEPSIRSEMHKVIDKHCRVMNADFSFDSVEEYTHCAQLLYNMNDTLSRRESCVVSLCASKNLLIQHNICKSQNVSFQRIQKYMTSTTAVPSSSDAYSDIVYHHMKIIALEYGVYLRYPEPGTHDVYINPKAMATIEAIRQVPRLRESIMLK